MPLLDNIASLTLTELKALGYDLVVERLEAIRRAEQLSQQLRVIDARINELREKQHAL